MKQLARAGIPNDDPFRLLCTDRPDCLCNQLTACSNNPVSCSISYLRGLHAAAASLQVDEVLAAAGVVLQTVLDMHQAKAFRRLAHNDEPGLAALELLKVLSPDACLKESAIPLAPLCPTCSPGTESPAAVPVCCSIYECCHEFIMQSAHQMRKESSQDGIF